MSHPTDPTGPDASGSIPGMHHELRRRGHVLGLGYEVGIRITNLSDEMEPSRASLLPAPQRLALPATKLESTEAQAFEGIGRWESEGGR